MHPQMCAHMTTDIAAPSRVRAAIPLLHLGLFASSLLVYRIGGFALGDLGLAAAAVVVVFAPGRKLASGSTAPVVVGLLVMLGATFSSFRSMDILENYLVALRIVLLVVVLPWLLHNCFRTKQDYWRGLLVWAAGAAFSGGGALLQYFFGPDIITGAYVTNAGRYTGFTQHPTDLGGITSVGLIVFVTAISRPTSTSWRVRFLYFTGGALCLIGLLLSGSVSGFFTVIVGLGCLVALREISVPRALALGGSGIFIALIALYIQGSTLNALTPIERLQQTLGYSSRASAVDVNTSEARLETYTRGLDGFVHNPVAGSGYDYKSGIVYGGFQVHNLAFAAAYQGGIFLALGLLVAIFISLNSARLVLPSAFARSAIAIAVSATAFAMTAPSLYNRYFWIPIAFCATVKGVAVSAGPIEKRASFDNTTSTPGARRRRYKRVVVGT